MTDDERLTTIYKNDKINQARKISEYEQEGKVLMKDEVEQHLCDKYEYEDVRALKKEKKKVPTLVKSSLFDRALGNLRVSFATK